MAVDDKPQSSNVGDDDDNAVIAANRRCGVFLGPAAPQSFRLCKQIATTSAIMS